MPRKRKATTVLRVDAVAQVEAMMGRVLDAQHERATQLLRELAPKFGAVDAALRDCRQVIRLRLRQGFEGEQRQRGRGSMHDSERWIRVADVERWLDEVPL